VKNFLFWTFLLLCCLLQISLGSNFGPLQVAIPLCLICLIAYSAFVSTEQLVYMALISGLVLDSASGRYFGLNIFLLLTVVIFCKLGLRLGERSQTLLVIIATVLLLVSFYSFLQYVGITNIDHIQSLGSFGSQLALQLCYSSVWALAVYAIASSIATSKLSIKSVRFLGFK